LINQLETAEAIHLTRYGKPVAVLISENQYQGVIGANKSLNSAILNWRSHIDQNDESDLKTTNSKPYVKRQAGCKLLLCRVRGYKNIDFISLTPILSC
jgi:hypothetical protein